MTTVNTNVDVQKIGLKDLKRTGLNKNEANFQDYLSVLGKDWIEKNLGGDKEIQQIVAQIFKTTNVVQLKDLQSKLSKYGITVSTEWKTDAKHMADQKAVGVGNVQISKGVTVITFKDKDGDTFKVADANGNAALESEELMFNEILDGLNTDLVNMAKGGGSVGSAAQSGIVPGTDNAKQVDQESLFKSESKKDENKTDANQNNPENREEQIAVFNKTVDSILWQNNYSITEDMAQKKAAQKLGFTVPV